MKRLYYRIIFSCLAILFPLSLLYAWEVETRFSLNMNLGWAFHRGDIVTGEYPDLVDSGWIAATLPHIMQLEKRPCGGAIIFVGIGWYRRTFKVPSQYKDKKISISFEGVMNACEVFLNGQEVYTHRGGYIGFVADLTSYLNWNQDNLLAVRVSAEDDPLTPPAKPQGGMYFYYYSGIYRDGEMVIAYQLYITPALGWA